MNCYSNGFLMKRVLLGGLMVLLISIFGGAQELLEMPAPTHFVAKIPRSKLVLVKEIVPDYEKKIFMAWPADIAVGKNGQCYVYDNRMMKIFIFNSQWECVGKILETGRKPGQLISDDGFGIEMSLGPDDSIYVHDGKTNKLLRFSPEGRFINERMLSRMDSNSSPFKLVLDKNGNVYSYSLQQGIIDQLDENMNLLHTFLDRSLNDCYVIYKPAFESFFSQSQYHAFYQEKRWLMAAKGNTSFNITANGLLFIYLHRPSTVYLFKGKQLVQQFDVRIDKVLSQFKEAAEKEILFQKKQGSKIKGVREISMFGTCFVDQDEPYFYLQFNEDINTSVLYQLDLKKKLTRIINCGRGLIRFHAKRNHLFFGITSDNKHPIIMEMEE